MFESVAIPLVFLAIILKIIHGWLYRPKNFPPGPLGLPILGSAYKLTSRPELDLMAMGRKYGSIMGVKIFDKLTVILSSPEAMHQALVTQGTEFSGRPNSIMFQAFTEQLGEHGLGVVGTMRSLCAQNNNTAAILSTRCGNAGSIPGVAGTDGPKWKENRKFGHSVFRKLGTTGQVMESWVQEEAMYLCSALQRNKCKPINIYNLIVHSTSNIICRLCFSDRIPFDDTKEFEGGARPLIDWFTKNSHTFMTLVFAPYLRFLPHFAAAAKDLNNAREKVYEFLRPFIARHKKNFDPNDIRDFADHYLQEIEKHKGDPTTTFTDTELLGYARDLFFGGSDTTVSSLSWVLVFLVNRPACQKKIQKEIDQIIGPDGQAKWRDYEEMHYTRAFFHEVMRYRTPGPQSLAHRAIIDTTLNGYFIPKDTQVITNLWSIHHDPNLFDQPNVFKPERFLVNGTFRSSPNVTPFSVGVRHCFGEPIAKMEMFLYVVTILQRFHLKPPTVNGQLPEDCERSGLFLVPPKFNITVRERFSRQRSIMKYKQSLHDL